MTQIVVTAVLSFVLGQVMSRFVLDPFHEWRRFRGDVAYALLLYANVVVAPGMTGEEEGDAARKHLRGLAGQVWQRAYAVPLYRLWAWCRLLPGTEDLQEASSGLVGLSNNMGRDGGRLERRRQIRKALRLDLGAEF